MPRRAPRATSELAQARKELRGIRHGDGAGAQRLGCRARPRRAGGQQRSGDQRHAAAPAAEPGQCGRDGSRESGARQQARQADAGRSAGRAGNLRRALDRAREQAMAQNQSGSGDPAPMRPMRSEGQQGQAGGQQRPAGAGRPGPAGSGRPGPARQPGRPASRASRVVSEWPGPRVAAVIWQVAGSGSRQGGGIRGNRTRTWPAARCRWTAPSASCCATRRRCRPSAWQQLREQLANGVLAAADRDLLPNWRSG